MILPALVLDVPHARATMRTEVTRAAAGKPFLAAVEVRTDPHWHVYWRNPGDSGIPTTVAWKAPRGWRVEPLEEPAPTRFAPGGVAAYGYEGRALFLARVIPSAAPGTLSASVRWLVCSSACIPGAATVSARVPLGARVIVGRDAPVIQSAYVALPRPAAGWSLRATKGAKTVTLVAVPPRGAIPPSVEFFPAESGIVDHAKPFTATPQGGRFVLEMSASPFPEPHASLKGLLVVSGARRQALSIDPKIENGDFR